MTTSTGGEDASGRRLACAGRDRALDFCPGCGHFNLTFDSVRLHLGAETLLALAQALESLERDHTEAARRTSRRFLFGIGGQTTALRLRSDDVPVLRQLLSTGLPLAQRRSTTKARVSELVN